MKIFLLFATAVFILVATTSSRTAGSSLKKENQPTCCNKKKCIETKSAELSPLHLSLFNI